MPPFGPIAAAREMDAIIDQVWVMWVGHRGLVIDSHMQKKSNFLKKVGWLILDKGWDMEDAGQKRVRDIHPGHHHHHFHHHPLTFTEP